MDFVTDTHPLIWALFAQKRLSPRVRTIFERATQGENRIFIPTIVIAESIMVVERGRVKSTIVELLQTFRTMQDTNTLLFQDLDPEMVIASHSLISIPDIFDRLVVAEARQLGLPLITCDTVITAANVVTTVWD